MRRHLWLLLAACQSSETALMLEVVPGSVDASALDEVVFRVTGPGIEPGGREARATLRGPGAKSFPLSLALVQEKTGSGPFAVRIEAYASGVLRATAGEDGPIAFESGRVVWHRFALRAVDTAPPADAGAPAPPPDAGTPPPPADGPPPPPPDAAPMPPPTCTRVLACNKRDPCTCDLACSCTIACSENECAPICQGAGTTCTIQGDGKKKVSARCTDGASCELACGDAETCEINCDGGKCLLRCEDAGSCALKGCGGREGVSCPGNVKVCGRPCP